MTTFVLAATNDCSSEPFLCQPPFACAPILVVLLSYAGSAYTQLKMKYKQTVLLSQLALMPTLCHCSLISCLSFRI